MNLPVHVNGLGTGISLYDYMKLTQDSLETMWVMNNQGTKGDYFHKMNLERILKYGYKDKDPRPKYADGTPAHTISVNHIVTQYDLDRGESPMITLRPIAWKSAIKEIFWIYQLQSNRLDDLHELGIKYWDSWDIGNGTIGQRYGATIRRYDMMNKLLDGLKNDPYGRRHIIDMWQVEEFSTPGLNPCCYSTTWNVRNDETGEYLDMELHQRSSDYPTSVCINEIQYNALLLMVAKHCGYKPGVFTHVINNAQVYDRHIGNAEKLLGRGCVSKNQRAHLVLDTDKINFYDFTIDDFKMMEYDVDPIITKNPQLLFDLGI